METIARQIAYYPIYQIPLIVYLGIITFISFLTTATLGYLIFKGHNIPIRYHKRMALLSLTLAFGHGLFGLLSYLK